MATPNNQPKSTRNIRWGIIGAGNIAHKLADAVAINPHSELVAVASRTAGKAEEFARQYNISAADSYQALVSRDDIDVVYIATTHNFHHDNARLALMHDKPVLLEKPFTVNAREAADLIDLARERRVFLMEAIWTRYLPSMKAIKQRLNDGEIGAVKHLTLSFGGFAPPQYAPRLKDPALAGGVTLDMGIYPISFVCYMLSERPSDIKSMCQFSDTGVDELAVYQFRFPSGATATISTSYNLKMKQEAVIYGSEGYIEYPDFQSGNDFTQHVHRGSNTIEHSESLHEHNHDNGFIYQVAEVVRCLNSGELESPVIPLDETLEIMRLMDGMRDEWGLRYPFE